MKVTPDIDLRERLGGARDQRARPTCLAFAASAAHEAGRSLNDYLSAEALFFNGVRRSHMNPRRGISAAVVAEALQHDGQPPEAAWPYLEKTPDPANWTPPEVGLPVYRAALEFSSRTVREVRELLDNGVPVLLLLAMTVAMYSPDSHGVIHGRGKEKITTQRHALLAVGYGHAEEKTYVLVRNSWGTHWGVLGHAWLHEPYLEKLLRTTGIITVLGTED